MINGYIGCAVPKPIVVRVKRYDPWRRIICECTDHQHLIAAIAMHLRRTLGEGGNLKEAYEHGCRSKKSLTAQRSRR